MLAKSLRTLTLAVAIAIGAPLAASAAVPYGPGPGAGCAAGAPILDDLAATGVDVLEIDNKMIEYVKNREQRRMKDYLANLDAHNLRFAPPIR